MPVIVTSRTRALYDRRPEPPYCFNEDTPLAAGLVAWYPLSCPGTPAYKYKNLAPVGAALNTTVNGTVTSGVGMGSGFATYANGNTANFLSVAAAAVTVAPLTLDGWFNVANVTANHSIISISRSATSNEWFWLCAAGGVGGDPVIADTVAAGSEVFASSATGFVANVWQHACAVFASSASRTAYLNAVPGTAETSTRAPASLNRTEIGIVRDSSNSFGALNGAVSDICAWLRALLPQEIRRRYDPNTRWEFYWPLRRRAYQFVSSGSSVFTATSALTVGAATLASTPTFAPGTKTASASLSAGPATIAGTVTFDVPVYTASAAVTVGAATLSASATFSPGTKTATSALTAGAATISATATFVAPVYTAAGAMTAGAATLTAAATFSPGTKTATAALSVGAATISADATFSPGVHTATATLSAPAATLAGSASFAPGTHTATASLVSGAATASASATFTAPVYTASAALAAAPATLAATGIFASAVYSSSAALTAGVATISASVAFTVPTYTATATLSAAPAVLAASGSFVAPSYTASAALTAGPATISASATATPPSFTATASLTAPAASLAASATFTVPVYSATASLTVGAPVLSATGGFTPPVYAATATLTAGAAVLAGTATFGHATATATLTAGAATIAATATFTPPTGGGLILGTFGCEPALLGDFSTEPAVLGTFDAAPAVLGTFAVEGLPVAAPVHYIGADVVETLTGLRDFQGNYLNAATVTYELKSPDGTTIGSGSYEYTDGSDGDYAVTIESEVTELERFGKTYTMNVTIVSGGFDDFRVLPRPAQYRGAQ